MVKDIIIIHGAGIYGIEMSLLSYRLKKLGYNVFHFNYSYYFRDLEYNTIQLENFLKKQAIDECNFVGHSLGGIIITHFLYKNPNFKYNAAITLASPHNGSILVKRLLKLPFGKYLVGKTLESFHNNIFEISPENHIAAIAGKVNFILGYLLFIPSPNDTLISCREVKHVHIKHYREVNATHASILFSYKVVELIDYFIQNKKFIDEKMLQN